MAIVHSQWWCIEIPDDWSAEEDDGGVSIADPDDVGELYISALKKEPGDAGHSDTAIDRAELRALAAELIEQGSAEQQCAVAGLQGLYFAYTQDQLAWREWYLTDGATLLLASYNCEPDNVQLDAAPLEQMLESLVLVDNNELAKPD
ncbi:MAG: hypothetical protein HKO71_01640 [Pseudomonadales bacterium]|nr:hypothetical protein [Pseudomonadales bacterium]